VIQARGEADGLPAPRHMFDVGVNHVLALLVGRRNNQRAVSMRADRRTSPRRGTSDTRSDQY